MKPSAIIAEKNSVRLQTITELIPLLEEGESLLVSKKVTAGFDGFVDTIVQVVKKKGAGKSTSFYKTKKEFGEYILQTEGSNCSLELEEQSIKLGGNMPIMTNALGSLGMQVNCIGAFGYPQIHPVFKNLSSRCHLHSFAEPGISTAIEFNDGKVILGKMGMLNESGWNVLKKRIGVDVMADMFKKSDLLCIVNWAEIEASTDIWKGLVTDIFPKLKPANKKPLAFFDLSDCSKRSSDSIKEALSLLKQFAMHARMMAGLNQNEARVLYKVLYHSATKKDLRYLGEKIFAKLPIETLVLHSSQEAIAFNKVEGEVSCNSFFIKEPRISTGAGDNFNAGFCTAQLIGLSTTHSLLLAHAISASYVQSGLSPTIKEVTGFLKTRLNTSPHKRKA